MANEEQKRRRIGFIWQNMEQKSMRICFRLQKATNFTNMYDPSGLFGGLWLLGNPIRASSDFFLIDSTLDTTTFAYINDDAIGAAGGAESAYLITEEITRAPGQRVFATFDVYFPQPFESCTSPNGGSNGEGFSEDLFFKVSSDLWFCLMQFSFHCTYHHGRKCKICRCEKLNCAGSELELA